MLLTAFVRTHPDMAIGSGEELVQLPSPILVQLGFQLHLPVASATTAVCDNWTNNTALHNTHATAERCRLSEPFYG